MQYLETEESKNKMTDRKAKLAAKQRMRKRAWRRFGWFVAIVAVLTVVYYTVGRSTIIPWVTGQAQATAKMGVGAAKGSAHVFGHKDIERTNTELEKENNPPSADPTSH